MSTVAKYLKLYLRLLLWVLKIAAPVNVVLFPSVALYGVFNSWGPAENIMHSYAGQVPVMVGASVAERRLSVDDTMRAYSAKQRSYLLFPSVLHDPKLVVVEKSDDQPSYVTETKAGFFLLFGWYLLCLVGTWWFWFSPSSGWRLR